MARQQASCRIALGLALSLTLRLTLGLKLIRTLRLAHGCIITPVAPSTPQPDPEELDGLQDGGGDAKESQQIE